MFKESQPGSEVGSFPLPVGDQTFGDHQQGYRAAAVVFFFGLQISQHLYGFTQAHIIGQDTPEFILLQEKQPVKTGFLIGAQLPKKTLRKCFFAEFFQS